MRNLLYSIVLVVLGIAFGVMLDRYVLQGGSHNTTIDSNVVLERIRSVSKLVTVEGEYSNVYNIDDYKWFNFGPFRKTATIKVQLKALVGIDLSKMRITADDARKTFIIDSIPDVEPIGIDPRVEYYDMDNGLFNSFQKEDLNRINDMVRGLATDAIKYGDKAPVNQLDSLLHTAGRKELNGFFVPLIVRARQEGRKSLQLIEFLANAAGWKVEYKQSQFANQNAPFLKN